MPFYLPLINEKVQHYQDMLFLVNENVILSWIPHLIEILMDGLTKYENIKFDFEMDNNNNDNNNNGVFIPQWLAFVTSATNNVCDFCFFFVCLVFCLCSNVCARVRFVSKNREMMLMIVTMV